ncbi:hypothetical protein [Phaeobacter sp. CAU 1743]|uniref:hypothetical protein n=1 Tax=Rhodobacterales TaxID=204455 RepID=UPI00325A4CE2
MKRFVRQTLMVTFFFTATLLRPSFADGVEYSVEGLQGIDISKICVSSGLRGGSADVVVVFENTSNEMVFLDGIGSDASSSGELFFKDLAGSAVTKSGFGVAREEVLNLSSSHIGARLTGLKEDLEPGDHPLVYLNFRNGTLETAAHVLPKGQCR